MTGWFVFDGATWQETVAPTLAVPVPPVDGGVETIAQYPIVRGLVYDGAVWSRFWPITEVTGTVITSWPMGGPEVGVSATITGTVTTVSGSITGGTVTVYQGLKADPQPNWVAVGTTQVTPAGGSAPWSATVVPTLCGDTAWKAVYSGSGPNLGSESVWYIVPTTIRTPTKPVGGTIGTVQATFTWTAVPGATSYTIYKNGVVLTSVTTTTYTAFSLTPNTNYTFAVAAKNGSCTSAKSPTLNGHTGQHAETDSGSMTLDVRPYKTNSWRPSTGWGYIGEAVGQGYFSSPDNNYSGLVDYGPSGTLRAAVEAELGTNAAKRYDNMTVSAARIYLHKKTGVGTSGSVTVHAYNSTAASGFQDVMPPRNGAAGVATSPAGGSGAWVSIGVAHWNALKAGTARSIVYYNPSAAAYAQFDGKSTASNRCNLQLECSWNYTLTTAVTAAWLN